MSAWAFGLTLMVSPAAMACDCATLPTPAEELEGSSVVFEGRAARVEETPVNLSEELPPFHDQYTTFHARRFWKGEPRQIVEMVGMVENTCNYYFQAGIDYLVFATPSGSDNFTTNICTLTRPSDEAEDVIQALGEGQPVPDAPQQL